MFHSLNSFKKETSIFATQFSLCTIWIALKFQSLKNNLLKKSTIFANWFSGKTTSKNPSFLAWILLFKTVHFLGTDSVYDQFEVCQSFRSGITCWAKS